ncbi:MAG: NADP-dependent malic enzyme [Bacteroidaceae bacterium]|jgi:malate dehydrogenase (oxaloacetate-decarboxylating)(NADP+)|uniref:NADP-dependent malic enzyme n=1 Tax=unclassified Bacteroides TaxID=2646097 RepID=UPI0004E0BA1C|nr:MULTISPECIES: NADP-dependent malic enzyme [unclassified Bacteroides]MBP3244264.1 NADP-dependent malic enzyme [Bacteroidaceae bacterium]SDF85316.1 allosteric NADP-dependent malic enzyme [Bacteroidales bacterium KHT7]MBP5219476.1 NADP-dependent malic enzyme [Bacteroidaceae bacterium]MBQ1677029.1 NADP-dependent malic enzyme [Bacteroidaceae bacterium]MBQ4461874.1 NADP-dependent malic enzyme [Bacteroidaceae bacterium]
MVKITKEAALAYHAQGKPGKIEVVPTKPYSTQTDLSLAYSPGVAEPCLEIQKNPDDAYKYTSKGNLVAVISNGTAVLGLGDIGAVSGKPVMEGKGLLFKIYGGIDVFDIEVNEKDPDKFIEAVKAIAPTFGGINLEDIKAPECFEIEKRLKEELDIPVMHDDQHGTAIISSAGLLNALCVNGKKIEEVKIVVNGAGAAAISCTKLYVALGARKENILMLDSKGVITADRPGLNEQKKEFATTRTDVHTLEEAVKGADVFLGLSKGGVLSKDMVRSMAKDPIVFALANPVPEITYEDAMDARPDVLMSTGRSDYPNQINNVIGFPYIFRGALDTASTAINEEMKLAAVRAIADLAKQPVPDVVNEVYHVNNFTFGRDYFIPKPVDPRLITEVSMAVAKAAMESGVARKQITDWDAYAAHLKQIMGQESKLTQQLYETARRNPQRVVFAEGIHPTMLKAAVQAKSEGICKPILLGNEKKIREIASELELNLDGIEIISLRQDCEAPRRERYAKILAEKRAREGYTYEEANDKMFERNYFGMMMVETGEADAFITGVYTKYSNTIKVAKEVVGIKPGYDHFGAMHILNSKKGTYFIADTLINRHPGTETLVDVARLAEETVKFFNQKPVTAMISYSNFGADQVGSPAKVHEAVRILQEEDANRLIDGEMQLNFALDKEMRDRKYPFSRLKGQDVNTLVFPNLSSANTAYKLIQGMTNDVEVIGPIQMGLNKPIHFTDFESSVREVVTITAIAAIDAIVQKKKK